MEKRATLEEFYMCLTNSDNNFVKQLDISLSHALLSQYLLV